MANRVAKAITHAVELCGEGTAVDATAAGVQAIAGKPSTTSPGTIKVEAGQEAPGASSPSLEDTAKWIESNLVGLHAEENDLPRAFRTFKISKASMNGCTLSYVTEASVTQASGYFTYTRTETAPLGQISHILSTTTGILAFATSGSIEIYVVYSAPTDGSEATPPHNSSNNNFSIETADEAMADRMTKALQHAVELCKAVSKPDLF